MSFLSRMNWTLQEQFGISPRKFFRAITQIPWFIKCLTTFHKTSLHTIEIMPCLHDRYDQSGSSNSEYFWQDLFVAQKIFNSSPTLHMDVGSRVDGFVAHVASFRMIEVVDIRPCKNIIPNVKFTQVDLMDDNSIMVEYCDSISCLHALEHFGLGRYGDVLDPNGWKKGLSNISKILKPQGIIYLSVPVGRPRVVFNAHQVFAIDELIKEMEHLNLRLDYLYFIEPGVSGVKGGEIDTARHQLSAADYNLAILVAKKSLSKS